MSRLQNMSMGAAVIIGLIVLALYYAAVYDSGENQLSQINSLNSQKTQKENEVKTIELTVQEAKKYDIVEQKMGEILTRIITYIPSNLKVNDVSRIIQRQAQLAGLNIVDLSGSKISSFGRIKDSGVPFKPLDVKVSLEGDFVHLMGFLSSLTQVDKIITIDSMSFNSDRKGRVKFSANFKGYRYVDNTKGGK